MMKWVLIGLGGLFLLAVAFLAALPYLLDAPKVQAAIADSASQALGRPVRFASLSLSLLPLPALRLTGLSVAEDPKFGTAPFLTVEAGRLRVRLWPLLMGRVEITELTFERPRLALIQAPEGRWNMASLGAPPGGTPAAGKGGGAMRAGSLLPLVSSVRVVGGSLSYETRMPGYPSKTDQPGSGTPITYRLEGLSLNARSSGLGAPISFEGETRITPGDLRLKIVGGSLAPEVGRPPMESAVRTDVELKADDVGPLVRALLGQGRELSGPVQGKLALSGTLARLAVRGELQLAKLRFTERRPNCPEPKTRNLTLEAIRFPLTYTPSRLTSDPLSARLGGGTATVAMTLELTPQPFLRLSEITVKALPLAPVMVDYLCQGYAVSGPLDLTGELAVYPGDPWRTLAGQGQLRIGAGRVVGPEALALLGGVARIGGALTRAVNLDLPPTLFTSPLEFDSITTSYRIADGRLTTQDFLYSSARLRVAASGEYGLTDGRMNLDLAVTSGRSQLRARVTGTTASPAIQVRTPQRILEAGPEGLRRFLRGRVPAP